MSFENAWDDVKTAIEAPTPGPALVEVSPKLIDLDEAGKLEFNDHYGLFLLRGPEPLREVHIQIRGWQFWAELQIGVVGQDMDRNAAYKALAPKVELVTNDLLKLRTASIKAGFLTASVPVQPLTDNRWVSALQFRFVYVP